MRARFRDTGEVCTLVLFICVYVRSTIITPHYHLHYPLYYYDNDIGCHGFFYNMCVMCSTSVPTLFQYFFHDHIPTFHIFMKRFLLLLVCMLLINPLDPIDGCTRHLTPCTCGSHSRHREGRKHSTFAPSARLQTHPEKSGPFSARPCSKTCNSGGGIEGGGCPPLACGGWKGAAPPPLSGSTKF